MANDISNGGKPPRNIMSLNDYPVTKNEAFTFELVDMYMLDANGNRIPDPVTEWRVPTSDDLKFITKFGTDDC